MKHPHPGLCLALTAAVTSLPALAQDPAFTLTPSADHQQLGSNYAAVGDIDGDGTADLAVSDPSFRGGGFLGAGAVSLISGADGSTLRGYQGNLAASQFFGLSLAALDADGDGVTDLAVGAPGQSGSSGYGAGAVWIFSGADGAVRVTVGGPAASQFGSALANAGDQNGDGFDDLFVGAPNAASARGEVQVISGTDGSLLRTIASPLSFASFGTTLAKLGDLDGDGRAEVAIGMPGFRAGAVTVGKVSVFRSTDSMVALEITGTATNHRLGESLAAVPDVNGDGLPELMAGSYSGGGAQVLSGSDLSTVADLSIAGLPPSQRVHVGGSLDFDADGTPDWLLGSPGLVAAATGTGRAGGIRVVSGADLSTLYEYAATASFTGLGLNPRVLPGLGFAAGESTLADAATGGRGSVHVWQVIEEIPVLDTDGDGVTDDVDAVPDSILDATVRILAIDSGVANTVDASGTSLADRFAALGTLADYRRPGLYVVSATRLAVDLACDRIVTRKEAARLTAAAAVGTLLGSLRR